MFDAIRMAGGFDIDYELTRLSTRDLGYSIYELAKEDGLVERKGVRLGPETRKERVRTH